MQANPLFSLRCGACGTAYPDEGVPASCPRCGGFWRFDPPLSWHEPADAPGLLKWAPLFGLEEGELTEREVARPPARVAGAWVFQQGSAPMGSYKERGAEVMAAALRRRQIHECFLDSSGNAGIAVARACAARGIRCRVLVPESTSGEKLEQLRGSGGEVVVVPGDRSATFDAAQELRKSLPYASHIFQPAFTAGVATLAWDFWAARGEFPEHVFLPAGHGGLLLGLGLGLEVLERTGKIARLPQFHAVQLKGYATLAARGPGTPAQNAPTAAGIAIRNPPRRPEMLQWIERTEGDVTVVTEEEIRRARTELAAAGYSTDPTGAAAWAGIERRPELRGQDCLVVLTSRAIEAGGT